MAARTFANRTGQCPISCVCIGLGWGRDPQMPLLKASISHHIEFWQSLPTIEREEFIIIWTNLHRKLEQRMLSGKPMWSLVRGPVSCLIVQLLQLGWKPIKPTFWISFDKKGTLHHSIDHPDAGSTHSVMTAAVSSLKQVLLKRAGDHHSGNGLQHGGCFGDIAYVIKLSQCDPT